MIDYIKKLGFFKPSFFFIFFSFYTNALPFEGWKTDKLTSASSRLSGNRSLNFFSSSKQIKISENLEEHLFRIMQGLVQAHQSLKEKQMSDFRSQINQISYRMNRIDVFTETALNYHQKLYLYRQLQEIRENMKFVVLHGVSQKEQMRSLKKAYKEFIQISQTYAIDKASKKYGIYFCSKNSSVWLQNKSTKVYNPFHKDYRSCGQQIR